MANMRPPRVPEEPPPVLSDDDLRRLLKACEGTAFAERLDCLPSHSQSAPASR